MEEQVKLLEMQIKALKELIEIKDQTINELKNRPVSYPLWLQPPYWTYPNPYPSYAGGTITITSSDNKTNISGPTGIVPGYGIGNGSGTTCETRINDTSHILEKYGQRA